MISPDILGSRRSTLQKGLSIDRPVLQPEIYTEPPLLSNAELREMCDRLPPPQRVEHIGQKKYAIYRVKSPYDNDDKGWADPGLKRLVLETRRSYREFGDVPLKDKYDAKAGIYLTRIDFPVYRGRERIPVTQLISLRFVPASGSPISNEDLDFYIYNGDKRVPILDFMSQRLPILNGMSPEEAREHIVAQSRLGRVESFPQRKEQEEAFEKYKKQPHNHKQSSRSGVSFALMNEEFLKDSQKMGLPFDILTCQMHEDLSDRVLGAKVGNGELITMPFTPANEILDVRDKREICIDRTNDKVYAYQYPGYFLNLTDLTKQLDILIAQGRLSEASINAYLPDGITFRSTVLSHPHRRYFSKMGQLLTANEINGSAMSGKALRRLADEAVPDGPIFRIMHADQWGHGIGEMIKKVREHKRNKSTEEEQAAHVVYQRSA